MKKGIVQKNQDVKTEDVENLVGLGNVQSTMRGNGRAPRGGRGAGRGAGQGAGRGRGRGRGRGNGPSGANGGPRKTNYTIRPSVSELPDALQISPTTSAIPSTIVSAFPEFHKPQPFFSALENLMPEASGSLDAYNHCWLGVSANSIESIHRNDENSFFAEINFVNEKTPHPIFVKRIHILEPVNAMEGEYIWPSDGGLPAPSELWKNE